ncbi:MAG: 16S rRNA (guanine(527)-N(7))-methyltransferase RsmG [Acidobacteriaceae bacterium]|nr:16S rRNA (guanine(527)-N(7))-methyltransferase RsmG [Acidobacteriaceae bacterium]
MQFSEELAKYLPSDLPNRDVVIEKSSRHLEMIVAANQYMNLTRITNPREAAIKHVVDSLAPWRLFEGASVVLDSGTGAGFPGLPLALVLPQVRFVLAESIQKKARFVESAIETLHIPNADVRPERAEQILKTKRTQVITARAMAPMHKLLDLFLPALKKGSRVLLYKGPDVDGEIQEAERHKVKAGIALRYELPEDMGSRTVIELKN